MMTTNDLAAYFTKMGLVDNPPVTVEGLTTLHRAQHRRIPFENFDIQLGRSVSVDFTDIVEKIVHNERGGYCFELNELMYQVLDASGFKVTRQLARVHKGPEPTGRSHQFSLVELNDQKWVVDTGFGSHTPRTPLPLEYGVEIKTDIQTFRFVKSEVYGSMLQVYEKNEEGILDWQNLYSFEFAHVCAGDIQTSNFFVSCYPESFFFKNRIAAFPSENGIVLLFNHSLKLVSQGAITEIELQEDDSYLEAIKHHFGIDLGVPIQELKPVEVS
ncbi:arylamine N-acetyltransferase [Vibrio profundi]|uniref:arylamine N-acetyltransferase family protein n=1 Tax=Vibrio profundi TaxID=1774960 RepID=UPI003736FF51